MEPIAYTFGEFRILSMREDADTQRCDNPQQLREYWFKNVTTSPSYQSDKELLVVILLNVRGVAIGWHLVSLGGLCEASAHPREVLRPAIIGAAHSIALMHNHPSGDPSPSQSDLAITRRVRDACKLLQIGLIDHVIIGDHGQEYHSFQEAGML